MRRHALQTSHACFAGAEHNALTVDLGFLTMDELYGSLIHYTIECGNDGMKGRVPSVPDGGTTLCLLGAGVAALGIMRRKIS